LVLRLGLSAHATFLFATIKGTAFVGITSFVLYVLLRGMVAQITRDAAEKRSLEQQFQRAQRMEALGRLAANVSHDFKNHLMVISGYADLLEVTDDKNCARRDSIVKAVQKCEKLSRELLAYSRTQDMSPTAVNVAAAISEMANMLSTVLGRNVTQETLLNSDSAIFIDPAQLEQVLMNLASNSKDAMPSGGTFCIEAVDLKVESEHFGVTVPSGEYVQIAVSDTGQGIPEEHRTHLFEPFFTTKEKEKGTGLGLAAVYGIIKQSGGFIFVDSESGRGTTFRLLFPKLAS
jgi:signal transduction histidine kinase